MPEPSDSPLSLATDRLASRVPDSIDLGSATIGEMPDLGGRGELLLPVSWALKSHCLPEVLQLVFQDWLKKELPLPNHDDVLDLLKDYFCPSTMAATSEAEAGWKGICKAAEIAQRGHSAQLRKNGDPYYEDHILRVVLVSFFAALEYEQAWQMSGKEGVAPIRPTPELVEAAYLHDLSEDTAVSLRQLGSELGDDLVAIVARLCKRPSSHYQESSDEKRKIERDLFALATVFNTSDTRVPFLKEADNFCNLLSDALNPYLASMSHLESPRRCAEALCHRLTVLGVDMVADYATEVIDGVAGILEDLVSCRARGATIPNRHELARRITTSVATATGSGHELSSNGARSSEDNLYQTVFKVLKELRIPEGRFLGESDYDEVTKDEFKIRGRYALKKIPALTTIGNRLESDCQDGPPLPLTELYRQLGNYLVTVTGRDPRQWRESEEFAAAAREITRVNVLEDPGRDYDFRELRKVIASLEQLLPVLSRVEESLRSDLGQKEGFSGVRDAERWGLGPALAATLRGILDEQYALVSGHGFTQDRFAAARDALTQMNENGAPVWRAVLEFHFSVMSFGSASIIERCKEWVDTWGRCFAATARLVEDLLYFGDTCGEKSRELMVNTISQLAIAKRLPQSDRTDPGAIHSDPLRGAIIELVGGMLREIATAETPWSATNGLAKTENRRDETLSRFRSFVRGLEKLGSEIEAQVVDGSARLSELGWREAETAGSRQQLQWRPGDSVKVEEVYESLRILYARYVKHQEQGDGSPWIRPRIVFTNKARESLFQEFQRAIAESDRPAVHIAKELVTHLSKQGDSLRTAVSFWVKARRGEPSKKMTGGLDQLGYLTPAILSSEVNAPLTYWRVEMERMGPRGGWSTSYEIYIRGVQRVPPHLRLAAWIDDNEPLPRTGALTEGRYSKVTVVALTKDGGSDGESFKPKPMRQGNHELVFVPYKIGANLDRITPGPPLSFYYFGGERVRGPSALDASPTGLRNAGKAVSDGSPRSVNGVEIRFMHRSSKPLEQLMTSWEAEKREAGPEWRAITEGRSPEIQEVAEFWRTILTGGELPKNGRWLSVEVADA